jgi:hypothetical protein
VELELELRLEQELLGSIVAQDQEPLDKHLKCSQIEAEFTIDKALPMIVQKIKCHRFKSRETFSKSLQFPSDQLLQKICRVSEPRLLQLAKLANNPSR